MNLIDEVVAQVIEQNQKMMVANVNELVKSIFACERPLSRRDTSLIATALGYDYSMAAVSSAIRRLVEIRDLEFVGMDKRVDVCGRVSHVPIYRKLADA